MFPSPYGELYFITNGKIISVDHEPECVSVPLRGALFHNVVKFVANDEPVFLFPSPYGELYFITKGSCQRGNGKEFPSPYGELYFITGAMVAMHVDELEFPSPYGELYFITNMNKVKVIK